MSLHTYISTTVDEFHAILRKVKEDAVMMRGLGAVEDGFSPVLVPVTPHEWDICVRHVAYRRTFASLNDMWMFIDKVQSLNNLDITSTDFDFRVVIQKPNHD